MRCVPRKKKKKKRERPRKKKGIAGLGSGMFKGLTGKKRREK